MYIHVPNIDFYPPHTLVLAQSSLPSTDNTSQAKAHKPAAHHNMSTIECVNLDELRHHHQQEGNAARLIIIRSLPSLNQPVNSFLLVATRT